MKRTKAFRRFKNRVKLNKRKEYFLSCSGPTQVKSIGWLKSMVINYPKNCNGWCCANPRKTFKEKTIQERISDINFKEQLNEI